MTPPSNPPTNQRRRMRARLPGEHPKAYLMRVAEHRAGREPNDRTWRVSWKRKVSQIYARLLEEHLGRELVVNVPPPGWTLEGDRAEELLALSELTISRRTS